MRIGSPTFCALCALCGQNLWIRLSLCLSSLKLFAHFLGPAQIEEIFRDERLVEFERNAQLVFENALYSFGGGHTRHARWKSSGVAADRIDQHGLGDVSYA